MPQAAEYGSLPFDQQAKYFQGKVNMPSEGWTDLWEGMHARAFVVAGATKDELLVDLRNAVDKAITQGTTLETFRKDFRRAVRDHGWSYNGEEAWRSKVIYETNLRTSYQAGRYEQQKAIAHRRPFWRYRHSDASLKPRPEHLSWDGLVLRFDDEWWSTHYPPNDWGCKCFVETLSGADMAAEGKAGPDEAPPLDMQTVTVGQAGRTVQVPKGVGPGWAYNVGEAAWGKAKAARLIAEEDATWVSLTPGNFESEGLPSQLAAQPARAEPGPPTPDMASMLAATRQVLGGDSGVFTLPTGQRVFVDAENLAVKLMRSDPARGVFLPHLPQLLEQAEEIWAEFSRSTSSNLVALRYKATVAITDAKTRGYVAVLDVREGHLVGWTFIPARGNGVNSKRAGKLIYRRSP